MPPALPPWPAPDAPAAAPGPTTRPPAAPPSHAGAPPRPARAPPPSTSRPCGCSTARRRAAAPPGGPAACRAAPASGSSASSRCAVAGRRARPDPRRCTAPAASRPTAPRTRSSRPPRPPRDPSPAARSPGRAGPSGRPPRRGTAPPAPPRSSAPPPPPRVRLPRAEAQPTGRVTPREPSPNTSYQRPELLTRCRPRSLAAPEAVGRRLDADHGRARMTIAITRHEPGACELRREARRCRDAAASRRMLAPGLVLEGSSRAEAARHAGMNRQTLRDWVHGYDAGGLDALRDRPRSGRRPRLTPGEGAELATVVEQGPDPDRNGVVRWRWFALQALREARF